MKLLIRIRTRYGQEVLLRESIHLESTWLFYTHLYRGIQYRNTGRRCMLDGITPKLPVVRGSTRLSAAVFFMEWYKIVMNSRENSTLLF